MAERFRSGKDPAITVQNAQWNTGDYFTNLFQVVYVMIRDALGRRESVVIDNTNVTTDIRRHYILLARMFGASVRAVYFENIEQAYTAWKKFEIALL